MFQNCFRISKLQDFLTTYKWVIMYMMYEKSCTLEYNKIKEWKFIISGDDLKFWSFFKMKHWICKESAHFLKFICIQ
jgi:hypothetical protein